jgi:hypothetical protein
MIEVTKPNGYWTKERCQKEALKCKSRTEFKTICSLAYKNSRNNKWINEIKIANGTLKNIFYRINNLQFYE